MNLKGSISKFFFLTFFAVLLAPAEDQPINLAGIAALTDKLNQEGTLRLAFRAAQLSYKLPEISMTDELPTYSKEYREVIAGLPDNYIVFGADGGVSSGLKFLILKPQNENAGAPWVLAITGTENLIDWFVDSGLGMDQFKELNKIIILCGSNILANKKLLITGHSLGGALAQSIAHAIQSLRNEAGSTAKVSLVTWNAFGAEQLIRRSKRVYNPDLLMQIDAHNYFIRGDIVSRIGFHFGNTYELVAPASSTSGSSAKSEIVRLHSLDTFAPFVNQNYADALTIAPKLAPTAAETIDKLTSISWLFSYGTGFIHSFRQLWVVRRMTKIFSAVGPNDFTDPVRGETIRYLYNVSMHEPEQLEETRDPDRIKFAPALRQQLQRIQPLIDDFSVRTRSGVSN